MTIAIFPGTFDPPTNGHIDIIDRASRLFDTVDVVVAVNKAKECLFSMDERLQMMRTLTAAYTNVTVHSCDTLIVNYAHNVGANVLLRGIRNINDYAYEFDLALMNRKLDSAAYPDPARRVETLFIPTDQRNAIIKSSAIKELASLGGDVSAMVPPLVAEALKKVLNH